jgi:hypothetical protein
LSAAVLFCWLCVVVKGKKKEKEEKRKKKNQRKFWRQRKRESVVSRPLVQFSRRCDQQNKTGAQAKEKESKEKAEKKRTEETISCQHQRIGTVSG